MNYFLVPLMFLLGFALIVGTFFVVKQQSAALVERFGKFTSTRQSGLQLKIPMVDKIAGRLSLKIQQLDVVVETKTKDDVFVKLKVSVQYKVIKEKVYEFVNLWDHKKAWTSQKKAPVHNDVIKHYRGGSEVKDES